MRIHAVDSSVSGSCIQDMITHPEYRKPLEAWSCKLHNHSLGGLGYGSHSAELHTHSKGPCIGMT